MDYFEVEEWETEWKEKAREVVENLYKSYKSTSNLPTKHSPKKSPVSKVNSHVFSKLKQREKSSEFEKYINTSIIIPPSNENYDILGYWKSRVQEFPILSNIAKDYLACPATSAFVEQIFSRASLLLNDERQAMSPDTIREMMCLENWGKTVWEKKEDWEKV